MADWNTAYNWMMDNEDGPRACKAVPDPTTEGPAFAISGINSHWWPTQFATIEAIPQDQREPAVRQFYHDNIWNNWYDQVASDDVCKRVFDFAVNVNENPAVRCLQQAVNSLGGAQIQEDGHWGPMTVGAVNAADPNALLPLFQAKRVAYYRALVANHPSLAGNLTGWTARSQK